MGGVVRAHYLMCEYLITKSDMGLTVDHRLFSLKWGVGLG